MRNTIIGFIGGVGLSLSMAAFAVNYARDIEPLNSAVYDLQKRVEALEQLTKPNRGE